MSGGSRYATPPPQEGVPHPADWVPGEVAHPPIDQAYIDDLVERALAHRALGSHFVPARTSATGGRRYMRLCSKQSQVS